MSQLISRFSLQNDGAIISYSKMVETLSPPKKQHRLTGTLKLPVKLVLRLWNYVFSNTNRPEPVIPHIPMDLIAEILCRLTVKDLLRFRCVCKSWNSLISKDPKFAKKHLSFSIKRPHFIVTKWTSSDCTAMSFSLDSLQLNSRFTFNPVQRNYSCDLIGSCHGIICFAINNRPALLWNPSTRKHKKLPSLELPKENGTTIYAFGYDPSIHKYKVVSVYCYDYHSNKPQVNIHTLGTHSWRRIQDFPSISMFIWGKQGIFIKSTVNWLALSHNLSRVIVSLDLGKESYQEISQPDYGRAGMLSMCMHMGCLCILSSSNSFTDVWLMKEYGKKESWIKTNRLPHIIDGYALNFKMVYIFGDKNHVLALFKEFGDNKLMWLVYDSKNGTQKTLKIQDDYRPVDSRLYVESLVSP